MARPRPPRLHGSARRRTVIVSLVATAVLALSSGIAGAYWTSGGTGTGSATTGTLAAPTQVAGNSTPGSGSVSVSWTASTGTPSPSGYYVLRTDSSSATSPACGTSASGCTDSSVPIGTYTYRVVAVYRSWTATSASSASVTVAKAAQDITFTSDAPANATVTDTYSVAATGGGSGNPVTFTIDSTTSSICSISGSTVRFTAAGTCTIDANQAASTYYTAAPQNQQTVTVGTKSQTISFTSTPPTSPIVGGTYAVAATATSTLSVAFTSATTAVCAVSGSTVSFGGAGTCTINADQAGNGTYASAPQVQQSFPVSKKSQTVSITSTPPTNPTVGGTYTVAATATSGLTVTITSATTTVCTVSGSTVTFVAAGSCTIDADQPGDDTYAAAPTAAQSVTVTATASRPTITGVSPTQLPHNGVITTVTIQGTQFQAGLTITLSDINYVVTAVNSVTSTTISVNIKNNYANSGTHASNLTVTNPDGGTVTKTGAISN